MASYPSLHPTYLEPDGQEFIPSWLGSGVEVEVEIVSKKPTRTGYFKVEKEPEKVQIYLEGVTFRQKDYAASVDDFTAYRTIYKTKRPLRATIKRIRFINND